MMKQPTIAPGTDIKVLRAFIGDGVWRTQDGRRYRFSDLDYKHLNNIIKKIEREGWQKKYHARLLMERAIRWYAADLFTEAMGKSKDEQQAILVQLLCA